MGDMTKGGYSILCSESFSPSRKQAMYFTLVCRFQNQSGTKMSTDDLQLIPFECIQSVLKVSYT